MYNCNFEPLNTVGNQTLLTIELTPKSFYLLPDIALPWKWILLNIVMMGTILYYNDALNTATYYDFMVRFRSLLDEMSMPSFLKPCRFPIELVSNVCNQSEEKEYVLSDIKSGYEKEFPFLYSCEYEMTANNYDIPGANLPTTSTIRSQE